MDLPAFNEPLKTVIDDLVPIIRQLFAGRYAIAVAGSHGKKKSDDLSDIDLRAYFDDWISDEDQCNQLKLEIKARIAVWETRGIRIDGYWPRRILDIENRLNAILDGSNTDPDPCIWTIWGYYLPTDITNNTIIEDPFSIISGWKDTLRTYPERLKEAVIKKHLGSALYWRHDYHYVNKVERQDTLFCVGLASLLVHHLIQVIFALNHAYYSGDGWNLTYISNFTIVPPGFTTSLNQVLLVGSRNELHSQRMMLCRLIDEVEQLVKLHRAEPRELDL